MNGFEVDVPGAGLATSPDQRGPTSLRVAVPVRPKGGLTRRIVPKLRACVFARKLAEEDGSDWEWHGFQVEHWKSTEKLGT